MADEPIKISLENGKYEFILDEIGFRCHRFGEEWREFVGDKAVLSLFLFTNNLAKRVVFLQQNKPVPWVSVKTAKPPPHDGQFEVLRDGMLSLCTVCYGMHAPWWVPTVTNEPLDMRDNDLWRPYKPEVYREGE